MLTFNQYARMRGYGGALDIGSTPPPSTFYFDLCMMLRFAEGMSRVESTNSKGETLTVLAGILLQDDINGLAERLFGQHFCSVTYGHCAALFHVSEKFLLSTKLLPDIGNVSGQRLTTPFSLIPEPELISDPARLIEAIRQQEFSDEMRSAASAYLRHQMFAFVLLHEYSHCTLGHCAQMEHKGGTALLREFGAAGVSAAKVDMHHGFELMADSHAAAYIVRAIHSKTDIPTRVRLFEADLFTKVRLAVLGIGILISMWNALDISIERGVKLHPRPEHRLLNVLDDVASGLKACGYDDIFVERVLTIAMSDLREASSWSTDVARALAAFSSLEPFSVLKELISAIRRYDWVKVDQFFPRQSPE